MLKARQPTYLMGPNHRRHPASQLLINCGHGPGVPLPFGDVKVPCAAGIPRLRGWWRQHAGCARVCVHGGAKTLMNIFTHCKAGPCVVKCLHGRRKHGVRT